MQITLEIDNPNKVQLLTELLKELSFVTKVKISNNYEIKSGKKPDLLKESSVDFVRQVKTPELKETKTIAVPTIVLSPKSWTGMTDEEAQKIIEEGCEMSSFGDPVEFQREVRKDRPLPFRD